MEIRLWKNSSDANVVSKSLQFLHSLTINNQFEKPLIDLTITLPKSEIVYADVINYVTIVDFDRDYFVKEVRKDTGGIISLVLHEDILSSHFNKIKNIDAWILRQEKKANLYVDDDEIIVQNRSDQVVLKFPQAFGHDTAGTPVGTNVMLVLGTTGMTETQ